MVRLKRVYEEPEPGDGKRVLVDRLWPRGLTKERARLDLWSKDVAPSDGLRKWFSHDPERWTEFRKRYRLELRSSPRKEELERLRALARRSSVTLLFAAKDSRHCNAAVLAEILNRGSTRSIR